ncbi:MAG TPA: Calx-beta domain-containing protein, partial [Bradyrhizobium sp.]|nr:Calx-beta domain-containing protein [Bradyrhizobium sp.]
MTQTINGTNGNDTINGTNKGDTIYAKGGNDTVNGGNGNDFIDAGSGNDTVNAGNGDDEVHGGTGNDSIDGGSGDDLIDGDSGDDILKGGAGCDVICGDDGNDTITGGTGNDLINGGAGTDTAIFAGTYASYDLLNLYGLVLINGQDGTDLVLDVEFLKFDNGIYNVATHNFTPNTPAQPLVSVVATDGAGTEAADGTDFTYTFKRTGDLTQALTVNYSINPAPVNGATPGVDLQPVTGTITFAAGSNTAVLQFNAIDDAIVENTETFSVVVGTGAGYQVDIPNATAGGSIIDNDFTPAVVSLTPATVTTTEGGALTFTFTRAGGNLAAPLTINYVVNDGGPAGGATRADGDFSYASGMQQITFAAGQTSVNITVQTNEDTKFEGTESFSVLLAGEVDYTVNLASSGSTGVILDNDPAPLVSVAATDGVSTETIDGTDFTFTFSRTGNTSSALTVNYSINP